MSYPSYLLPSPFQERISSSIPETDYIDVNGQAVPLWLQDPEIEYRAFRETVGLIDFSMLFKFEIKGPGAIHTLNEVFSRDVKDLPAGSIAYGVVVDDAGGMMDDCTALIYSQEQIRLTCGNYGLSEVLKSALKPGQILVELRDQIATLSVQGPHSRALLQSVSTDDWSNENFPYYTFKLGVDVAGIPAHVNRMGFTAELGYEVMVERHQATALWDSLIHAGKNFGAVACAAAALMTARVEAGMIMSGLEYDEDTSPYECRMGWSVDLEKGPFRGREALTQLKGSARFSVVSLVIDSESEGLDDCEVQSDDLVVGRVTMAVASPQLGGRTLALARINRPHHLVGSKLTVKTAEGIRQAEVVSTPVYDPERLRVRS